jgi:hypothetical protein
MATNPPPNPPTLAATYQDVLTRLSTVSKAISDMLRTLGIGTVVFCWGLFTADKGIAQDVANRHHNWIVITAAVAVLGLILDLLQAVASYWVANTLRKKMEDNNEATGEYDYTTRTYRSQTWFFVTKAILMPAAAVSIIALLFLMVWNAPPAASAPPPTPAPCCQCCPAPPVTPAPSEAPKRHASRHKARPCSSKSEVG